MVTFRQFIEAHDVIDARDELALRLVESNVNLADLNRGLDIISEWGYNPFRTGTEMGGTTAGAALGSAFGPLGTFAGGVLGNVGGRAASWLAGKAFGGVTVDPISPVHKQARDAVDKLMNLLQQSSQGQGSKAFSDPKRQKYLNNIKKVKDFLDTSAETPTQIDADRNTAKDAELKAAGDEKGTSVSGYLKNIEGQGLGPRFLRWLGSKTDSIPVLNKEKGLRRAIAQGMDALQTWAAENPKKAAVLDAAAGLGGAAAGAAGAAKIQGAISNFQQGSAAQPQAQQQAQPQQPQQPQQQGGDFQRPSSQVQSLPSGRIDNGQLGDSGFISQPAPAPAPAASPAPAPRIRRPRTTTRSIEGTLKGAFSDEEMAKILGR